MVFPGTLDKFVKSTDINLSARPSHWHRWIREQSFMSKKEVRWVIAMKKNMDALMCFVSSGERNSDKEAIRSQLPARRMLCNEGRLGSFL